MSETAFPAVVQAILAEFVPICRSFLLSFI